MENFLLLTGFLGIVGSIIYLLICFIKKKKKKIALFVIAGSFTVFLFGVFLLPPADEVAKADKEEVSKKAKKKKEITLSFVEQTVTTDENGKVKIEGTVTPGSDLASGNETIPVNSEGHFSYTTTASDNTVLENYVYITATKKGYADNTQEVTILNNSNAYNEHAKKVAAEQKAADEKVAAEEAKREAEEAAKKAKEEEQARKEEAAKKEKERLGVEGESALIQAESYSEIMNMSKAGIYDQLTSDYGGQFSDEAAQYAVDNLKADYNRNALEQAKEYQETMSMSPGAIHDQLTSDYGGQFTQSEADYAIEHLND
ncbi:Ltp family lipoprotein [Listeria seeligeri]|uniref:Ltp family lipoprotein n=1 Tax=Listeria seeligeri TaxID=1640 RepID=UPI001889335E|nr:Ltp family lipoprotein [Listeria seeligeri]MBF2653910.1 Ltp family lipoprotein [Listeria seeligeri]